MRFSPLAISSIGDQPRLSNHVWQPVYQKENSEFKTLYNSAYLQCKPLIGSMDVKGIHMGLQTRMFGNK